MCRRDGLGQLAQMGMVSFGHDQGVAVDDRIDVEEGHSIGRFKHSRRRNLAVDDLAENTRGVGRSQGMELLLIKQLDQLSEFSHRNLLKSFLSKFE